MPALLLKMFIKNIKDTNTMAPKYKGVKYNAGPT